MKPLNQYRGRCFRAQSRRTQRAFLMLDTLVAILISTLIIVGCYIVLSQASSAANVARQNNTACAAARQILENIRQFKGAKLATGTYSDVTVFGAVPQIQQLNQNGITGSASAVIASVSGRNGLKQVTVTIKWQSGGNTQQRSRIFTTYITSGGLVP